MSQIIKPPARLYKYAAFSAQNLENLKNQIIYFNSPRNFNDPYDCSVTPRIRIPSDAEVESVRSEYLKELKEDNPLRQNFNRATTARLRDIFVRSAANTAAENIKKFSELRGVSCFSEGCNDLLMWAHYGGNYRGFCLEFDTSYFQRLHKVKYSEIMPTFDPIPILRHELDVSDFMSIFTTKSLSWAYEKEWRAIHESAGTNFGYPPEALTGVYFGPEISQAALEIICLILRGQNETVRFWQGVRDPLEYKVDFNKVDYLSHLQARKRGYGATRVPVSFRP